MFNFKFTQKDQINIEVDVNTTVNNLKAIQEEAEKETINSYNQVILIKIKEKLYKKYNISDPEFPSIHSMYIKEKFLVDAILEDLAKQLNLLK